MTRKDYELIASVFREKYAQRDAETKKERRIRLTTLLGMQNRLAQVFANSNPRFDQGEWDRACSGSLPRGVGEVAVVFRAGK